MRPVFRLILAFPNVGLDEALESERYAEYLREDEFRGSLLFPTNYILEIKKILDSHGCSMLIVDGSISLAKYLDAHDIPYAIVCRESHLVDVDTVFSGLKNAVLRYYIDNDKDGFFKRIVRLARS